MKTSEFKEKLNAVDSIIFQLPNGKNIPSHFHITEMGVINKQFTDCGNTFREENYFTFQLWHTVDLYHRLKAEKVLEIIEGIGKKMGNVDFEIQIEYQFEGTIGKFGLDSDNGIFKLISSKTACLATESCGLPTQKIKTVIKELAQCCDAESNCC